MTLYEQFLKLLDKAIERYGNARQLAETLEVHPNLITRWKNKERVPSLTTIQPLMDLLGAKIISQSYFPEKEICFVNARVADNYGDPSLIPEDYIAAPLMGEVGAGTGYLPQEHIDGWFLVYDRLLPVQHSRNLIAVEIGAHSTSMQPTLNPKDIVLVDRDNKDISQPGNIMLVLDPMNSSGMIKRVSVKKGKDDCQITYYSDNAAKWPPVIYSLNNDFDGEWSKSIVGRVICAWTDMRNK